MTLGEHPPFSPEELAEIRRLAANEWTNTHRIKNETAVPSHRDKLTLKLLMLERIEEKTLNIGGRVTPQVDLPGNPR